MPAPAVIKNINPAAARCELRFPMPFGTLRDSRSAMGYGVPHMGHAGPGFFVDEGRVYLHLVQIRLKAFPRFMAGCSPQRSVTRQDSRMSFDYVDFPPQVAMLRGL